MTALLAITLLSLLGIVLAIAFAWNLRASARKAVEWADARASGYCERMNDAVARSQEDRNALILAKQDFEERLAAAERRARSRESKYSRRQPETPAPLPENAP